MHTSDEGCCVESMKGYRSCLVGRVKELKDRFIETGDEYLAI